MSPEKREREKMEVCTKEGKNSLQNASTWQKRYVYRQDLYENCVENFVKNCGKFFQKLSTFTNILLKIDKIVVKKCRKF